MKRAVLLALGLSVVVALVLLYAGKGKPPESPGNDLLPDRSYGERVGVNEGRDRLQAFIDNRLTGPYGVYTNYEDTDQVAEVATGHEVLSESASLQLRISAIAKRKEAFDRQWSLAKEVFDRERLFSYRFSPKSNKAYPVNAAVDDLRFIRALYEAGEAFGVAAYTEEANKYGMRFYLYNIKNGYVYDFYDETYRTTNTSITLSYIDLKTLRLLPVAPGERQQLLDRMAAIAQNGYLSDAFPFYETRFHYDTNVYSSDTIQTVDSMLTILHLAETRQARETSIRYLKEQVQAGALYGQYTREGVPVNAVQSTAIYAIAAMIGAEVGDRSLYEQSIRRMNEFQIKQTDSPFYGGFADTRTKQAFSFDNLMALLAYWY